VNALEFERKFGRAPENDDIHRVTCDKEGELGHMLCGVCPVCDGPKFECGGQIGHMAQPPSAKFGGIDIPEFMLDFRSVHGEVLLTITDHLVEGEPKLYRSVHKAALAAAMGLTTADDHKHYLANEICKHLHHLVNTGDLRRWGEGNWYYKERRPA